MAVQNPRNPSRVYNTAGVIVQNTGVLSDGDATWKASQFLRSGADGLLYETSTGGASGVGADAINYYALTDLDTATTGVDTNVRTVGIIQDDDVFEINENNTTVPRTTIGNWYDMVVSANLCSLNVDSTSHAVFEVMQPKWAREAFQNDSADTLALAFVKILGRSLHASKV